MHAAVSVRMHMCNIYAHGKVFYNILRGTKTEPLSGLCGKFHVYMLTTGRSIGAALPTANFEYRLVSLGAFLVAPDFSPSFMFETLRQRVSLGIACLAKPHCFMSPWSLK